MADLHGHRGGRSLVRARQAAAQLRHLPLQRRRAVAAVGGRAASRKRALGGRPRGPGAGRVGGRVGGRVARVAVGLLGPQVRRRRVVQGGDVNGNRAAGVPVCARRRQLLL
jgi:hypothetical protein